MRVLARLLALLLALQLTGAAPVFAEVAGSFDTCGETCDGCDDGFDACDCTAACPPCACCHLVASAAPALPNLGERACLPSEAPPARAGRPLDGSARGIFQPPKR